MRGTLGYSFKKRKGCQGTLTLYTEGNRWKTTTQAMVETSRRNLAGTSHHRELMIFALALCLNPVMC